MPLTIIIILAIALVFALFKINALTQELSAVTREVEEERKIFSSLGEYNNKQKEIKNQKKAKVMELFDAQEKLTNKKVAQELGVSNVTAFRYLEELEQEGQIRQVRKLGRFVYYSKTS
jgi:response regulator of citrate/malate metabolism